ncbi:MAG TPA: DNA polymerase ligase N-terminal domain-containing protein, partial [bacterium]|nr:DNA polymerase ligase N-terminal domain-containing protein [bacterium]
MPLEAYRRKRDFTRTREPRGRKKGSTGPLSFVVQKHAARRLHYDFRLELDGVLKSWAVPKGPSLDPGEKRLAVHVEDHPLEYGAFEGRIPEGEYGAGTVEIWDKGHWIPDGDPREGYRNGRLKFTLKGHKLRGAWNLVRMKGRNGRARDNWLLMKAAGTKAGDGAAPRSTREVPSSSRKGALRARSGAQKSPLPEFVEPQLAILVDDPPAGEQWVHEIKYDGYRLLCRVDGGKVRILTRHGKDWTDRFQGLVAGVKDLPVRQALIDGEAVVLDARGISSFQALQEALSAGRDRDVVYFSFDLLHLDGLDLRRIPLVDRKAALAQLLKDSDERIRYSDHVEGNGEEFFRRSCAMSLEGILSKRKDGVYESGRSGQWLKVKCER